MGAGKSILHLYVSRVGFEPGSLSESLVELDTCSKLLGHHAQLKSLDCCEYIKFEQLCLKFSKAAVK